MLAEPLGMRADLSETSLDAACRKVIGPARRLYVSSADIREGARLAELHKLLCVVDLDLPANAWIVTGQWGGIYSPGP